MKDIHAVIGCDPSYAHFGLAILNIKKKEIYTYDIETVLGGHNFQNVCEKAKEQVDKVDSTIVESGVTDNIRTADNIVIGMENALPFAFNATELTALDVLLYYRFGGYKTLLYNPTYLKYIMGKHTKKDSINLANGLISILQNHGYNHTIMSGKKLTDGEAEALIYSVRVFCRTFPEDEITKSVLDLQPLFADEKENFSSDFIY